jgi:hypothetical protein
MSIEIIKQPPLRLTQSEFNRLMAEYRQAFLFYSGPPPAFEDWARGKVSGNAALIGDGK